MRILLITQEFPPNVIGGVGYHAYHLAAALTDQGHTVHVLTGTSARHATDNSVKPLDGVSISTIEYRRQPTPRLWFARRARRWLNEWDRLSSFDAIHAHEYLDFDRLAFDGTTIQKIHFNLTEKPTYLTLDFGPDLLERAAFTLANTTIWRAERRLERRALASADVTIANSRLTRSICADRHAIEPVDIEVVYNGVDADQFSPPTDSTDRDALLFVGGDSERKGFSRLLDTIRRCNSSDMPTVQVVGETDRVDTRQLEETLPIKFLGRVSQRQLRTLYQNATALVHPALYEPFGNVVLEALACGTPVVVADPNHCGAAELIDDATGIVVDPASTDQLVEAVQSVRASTGQFSPTACRALAARHTWSRVADRTVDAVQSRG